MNQIKLPLNRPRKAGKIVYSDKDEDLDSEKNDSDIPATNYKDNIFLLFSFDRQKDYLDRVKRLQGKVITKSLSNKMEEKLKKNEGKYYFSDDESEEEEKQARKEVEEEKKEAESDLISKQAKKNNEPLFPLGYSCFIGKNPEQEKKKYEDIFNASSNNNDQIKNKDKMEEGSKNFSLFKTLPENDKNKFPKEPPIKPS